MVIRLLPASVGPPEFTGCGAEVSTSLVPYTRGAVATRVDAHSEIAQSGDTYIWSIPPRGEPYRIYGTPVEDSESENASGESGDAAGEYVSGSWWSRPIERTAAALYSVYAAISTAGSGQLIDVYA